MRVDKNSLGLPEAQRRIEEARKTGATELQLINLKLASVPEALGELSHLTALNLSFNKLQSLPDWLGELPNLTVLWLQGNKLQNLPDSLGNLNNLTHLYLAKNKLQSLPDSVGQLSNLTVLDLTSNNLQSLPEGMRRLEFAPNLTGLYLHKNLALAIPPEILGPTWQRVFEQKKTPADPVAILRYYFGW